jgi:UDP-glucose 4-epimerase
MRILVTGGFGFIGHNVVALLEDMGHEVTVVDNHTNYGFISQTEINALIQERQFKIYSVNYPHDISEPAVETAFRANQPELVIHLASFPRQNVVANNPVLAANTMVKGLVNLCEISHRYQVRKFIYVSSSMVYGDFTDGANEHTECNPIGQYAIMKLAGEHIVRDYGRRGRFDFTIVRPSAVYGPRDVGDRVISKFFLAAMRDEVLTVKGAYEKLDFTYVEDTALGIVGASLTALSPCQTYNITRGVSRTLLEAATIVTGIVGKGTIKVMDKDQSFPSRAALSIENAKKDFGFDPKVDIEEGFQKYYDYLTSSPFWIQKCNTTS